MTSSPQEVLKGAAPWCVVHGDILDRLPDLPDECVDVVVTDPPAGIGFMGKPWDSFKSYKPRTVRGREICEQLGGGDLLARATEMMHGLAFNEHVLKLRNGQTSDEAMKLVAELRAASNTRPLMPAWARGFVVFMVDVWSEVFRVLKPGGFVCAWALPKTADLAGLALRAADFETRDSDRQSRGWVEVHESVLHLFGSGMNKSGCIGKKIDKAAGAKREVVGHRSIAYADSDKWGTPNASGKFDSTSIFGEQCGLVDPGGTRPITAPATDNAKRWTGWHSQIASGHEQWLIARKPTRLTYAQQMIEHRCGAFHVDACRVPRGEADREAMRVPSRDNMRMFVGRGDGRSDESFSPHPSGSHPRNVVLSAGGDGCPVAGLDRQSGVLTSGSIEPHYVARASCNLSLSGPNQERTGRSHRGDSGGASRYFTRFDQRVGYFPKASDRTVPGLKGKVNKHPTHKHVALMTWLCALMGATTQQTEDLPAVVLDPFNGSGTTGVGAVLNGLRYIGYELDETHVSHSRRRIREAEVNPEHYAKALKKLKNFDEQVKPAAPA